MMYVRTILTAYSTYMLSCVEVLWEEGQCLYYPSRWFPCQLLHLFCNFAFPTNARYTSIAHNIYADQLL